jgi:hypothetical protein
VQQKKRRQFNQSIMHVSKSQAADILAVGTGGALVATFFKLFNLWFNSHVGEALSIETEAMQHVDRHLLILFHQMEPQSLECDKVAFARSVDACDCICQLRAFLEKGTDEPNISDRENAIFQFGRLTTAMQRLVKRFEENLSGLAVVALQKTIQNIMSQTEKHMEAIFRVTSDFCP